MPSEGIGPLRNGSELLLVQTGQESCGGLPSAHQLVSMSKCNSLLILMGHKLAVLLLTPHLATPGLRPLQPSCFSSPFCSYMGWLLASPQPWTLWWWTTRNWSPNTSESAQPAEQPVALVTGACSLIWCGCPCPPQCKTRVASSPVWSVCGHGLLCLSLFW